MHEQDRSASDAGSSKIDLDLLNYIKDLISEKTKTGEFIYAVQIHKTNPYELKPISYDSILKDRVSQYFTVSRTGVRRYVGFDPTSK